MDNRAILPIIDIGTQRILATGFIASVQGASYLFTAGHTFATDSIDNLKILFEERDEPLNSLELVCNELDFEITDRIGDYRDCSIFKFSRETNVNFDELVEIDRSSYEPTEGHCLGYDIDTKLIESHPRTNIRLQESALISFNENTMPFKAQNCRTGYGFCKPGLSGGPVIVNDKIVGMTVWGAYTNSLPSLYRRQHFITSNYLLEKIRENTIGRR